MFEEQETSIVNNKPILFISPYLLRLSVENYREQLANFSLLRSNLKNNPLVVKKLLADSGSIRTYHTTDNKEILKPINYQKGSGTGFLPGEFIPNF